MQAVAKARFISGSARKMRLVANLIRGRNVEDALNMLRFMPQKGAPIIEKVVRSAVANAQNVFGDKIHDPNSMKIIEAQCGEGPTAKRIRARARGRAVKIRKRTCHIKVTVAAEE